LIAWPKVTISLELGGLGISNLQKTYITRIRLGPHNVIVVAAKS
jgi:hypothetical protein